MNVFRVLNVKNPDHYAIWHNYWLVWSFCEVFAHPEYAILFSRTCDYTQCAVMECEMGLILLPMIMRPLCVEVWAEENNPYYDVVTPYGFGGPYVKGECDMVAFWEKFDEWARENRVVSAFFRLPPFMTDIKAFKGSIEVAGGNVIRSLTDTKEQIWKDYSPKVRCNTRRAEREGIWVEVDGTGARIDDFMSIYYGTMQRRNARDQYYFKEEFFRAIIEKLTGQFVFFHGVYCGQVISTELVLISQDNLYAFLGGTDQRFFGMHPNELLRHTIIMWGVDHGKKNYVLGGGYNQNDGILRYKKEFSPHGVITFEVGKCIYDEGIYQCLCERRKKYELARGGMWDENSLYFPLYRVASIQNIK